VTLNYSLSLNPNRCHYPLITYLRFSNAGLGIQTGESGKLKLESFAVLLPIDIVVSVKLFALIMAFPVVEFSREGYKIRKVFG
jgi:hypothetical protein